MPLEESQACVASIAKEKELGEDEYLITRNDVDGRITYVNARLVDVTGYAREDLIGASPTVLYHTDMPDEVNVDLRNSLEQMGNWTGFVKHQCKDGSSFWAVTSVTSDLRGDQPAGYTSVRTRAVLQEVELATRAYANLKAGHRRRYTIRRGRILKRGIRTQFKALTKASAMLARFNYCVLAMVLCLVAGVAAANARSAQGVTIDLIALALVAILSAASAFIAGTLRASASLRRFLHGTRKFAAGDLSADALPMTDGSPLYEIGYSLSVMQKGLALAVRDVRRGIHFSCEAANEIAVATVELSDRIGQQASSLEHTASTTVQLAQTVRSNMNGTTEAHHRALEATLLASEGRTAAAEAVDTMRGLSTHARAVAGVSTTIESIAFQTNLLALNASVEAARAGAGGRGFAVVANEVRALAQRTSSSAKEIHELISVALSQIEMGARQVITSGQVIEKLAATVDGLGVIVGEIAEATREQGKGVDQLERVIRQLDEVTQHIATMAEQSAASTQALVEQNLELEIAMATSRLSHTEM